MDLRYVESVITVSAAISGRYNNRKLDVAALGI